ELIVHTNPADNSQGLWGWSASASVSACNDQVAAGCPTADTVMVPNGDARVAAYNQYPSSCDQGTYAPGLTAADANIFTCIDGNQGAGGVALTVRSRHTGGVTILFGDGSVRFVSDSVAPMTWRSIFTMAGGEVTNLDL